MNSVAADPVSPPPTSQPSHDLLRNALVDSRQRWRDLVTMAADLVFETDAAGCFVLLAPDPALGWSAASLLGQPSGLLLADSQADAALNPFHPGLTARRSKAWLRRADGSLACLAFAVAPLLDHAGRVIGARGLGSDVTEREAEDARIAAALRRGDLVDHILWRMRQEVLAPRMMQAVLDSLLNALGAEGAAVLELIDPEAPPMLRHEQGSGAAAVLIAAARLLHSSGFEPAAAVAPDGRQLLACGSETRFGERAGLVLWRPPQARRWDSEDRIILASTSWIVRVVLEHESIQREMARQARTDPLTGLLNRGAFLQEATRRLDRLEREALPGALMFIDLDNFKALNDRGGHEAGDVALRAAADLLRRSVRPTDLVARLGGDEFALWLDGADQFAAAERAEALRLNCAAELNAAIADAGGPLLSMSIGIAVRQPGGDEDVDTLTRRADAAMYEVKRAGRGHWRVAQPCV